MMSLQAVIVIALTAVAVETFGGSLEIEENGIKIPIQMGQAGGLQAEIFAPILPVVTDFIKLAQEAVGKLGGTYSLALSQPKHIRSLVVSNIEEYLKAVGMPVQTLIKGAGSLINNAINQRFISAQKANEILISVTQSALSNTLNRFADVVNMVQYAFNQKLILEQQALAVLGGAAQQRVHLMNDGRDWSLESFLDGVVYGKPGNETEVNARKTLGGNRDWSLESFLDAIAQGYIINANVADTLKTLLRGNTAADGSFQMRDNLNIDVTVTDA